MKEPRIYPRNAIGGYKLTYEDGIAKTKHVLLNKIRELQITYESNKRDAQRREDYIYDCGLCDSTDAIIHLIEKQ